ncbi:proton-coupled amino acid transporter 2-like isoform X4 [Tachypleus tridentatus]|uniref:proton-coupled amino acid transporter 2-like isoform X4 n=1 Tax=Tachypleus tridentatus TaxID=6853 RepID=UPI003FD11E52
MSVLSDLEKATVTAIKKLNGSDVMKVSMDSGHVTKTKSSSPGRSLGNKNPEKGALLVASDGETYMTRNVSSCEYESQPHSVDAEETVQLQGSREEKRFHKTTNCETLMNFLKGNTGAGILALPNGFMNAGLLVGTLGIPFMALLCTHCMHTLVHCSRHLSSKLGQDSLDYSKVALYACKLGPAPIQKYGRTARRIINVFLMVTQFGFCCIYLVFVSTNIMQILPIENEMKTPEDFGGCNGVLNTGMVFISCLYVAMGFFGYLKYGEEVAGSITLNLPARPIYELVRVIFAVSVFLSYPLQFYVPLKFIWPFIKKKKKLDTTMSLNMQQLLEHLLRASLVLLTYLLALAIPKLDLFISLVGAFASSCLAMVFPCILEVIVFWDGEMGRFKWVCLVAKNVFIAAFGAFGFATGTYASIKAIVAAFS